MIALAALLVTVPVVRTCGADASHSERIACSAIELERADKRLDLAWHRYHNKMMVVARQPPDGGTYAPSTEQAERKLADRYLKAVSQAQARFRAFRDAQCFSEGFPTREGSGSDDPIIACKTALTNAQAARLETMTKAIY